MKLVIKHAKDCRLTGEWVMPELKYMRWDRIGRVNRRASGTTWLFFKCNDPRCKAEIAVEFSEVQQKLFGRSWRNRPSTE